MMNKDENSNDFTDCLYTFEKGCIKFSSEKLRVKDHKTGIPNTDFIISFEFQTKDPMAPLFSINSPIGKGGHDRHIYLQDGVPRIRIWPGNPFAADRKDKLNDDKWHFLELQCQ